MIPNMMMMMIVMMIVILMIYGDYDAYDDHHHHQSLSPGVDCQGALEAARRFFYLPPELDSGHPTSYYSSGSQMTKSFTLDTGSSLSYMSSLSTLS